MYTGCGITNHLVPAMNIVLHRTHWRSFHGNGHPAQFPWVGIASCSLCHGTTRGRMHRSAVTPFRRLWRRASSWLEDRSCHRACSVLEEDLKAAPGHESLHALALHAIQMRCFMAGQGRGHSPIPPSNTLVRFLYLFTGLEISCCQSQLRHCQLELGLRL